MFHASTIYFEEEIFFQELIIPEINHRSDKLSTVLTAENKISFSSFSFLFLIREAETSRLKMGR